MSESKTEDNTSEVNKKKPLDILIVEDDISTQEVIKTVMIEAGHSPVVAGTATEARKILEDRNFDLQAVFLDLGLPDADGQDFLQWIKLQNSTISVIIVSASKGDNLLIECLNKGASDFVEKPFKPSSLIDIVEHAVRRQKLTPESAGDMRADIFASDWIELTAQSEMEYLGRIQRFSEILFTRRLPQKVVDDLRLAMEEFGRNAVEWGNKFAKDKQFRVNYCFFPDRVVLKFEDEGEGFDRSKVPDPSKDPIAHLKNRQEQGKRPGGFGIFMMNKIMDEVVYNEKGNLCIMTKYLPKDGENYTQAFEKENSK